MGYRGLSRRVCQILPSSRTPGAWRTLGGLRTSAHLGLHNPDFLVTCSDILLVGTRTITDTAEKHGGSRSPLHHTTRVTSRDVPAHVFTVDPAGVCASAIFGRSPSHLSRHSPCSDKSWLDLARLRQVLPQIGPLDAWTNITGQTLREVPDPGGGLGRWKFSSRRHRKGSPAKSGASATESGSMTDP